MKIVTYEMHHAPLIFLGIIYDAGPRNEYPGITGISHILEHMMFMGTQHYPGDAFINQLRRFGVTLNGFTTNDFVAFYDYFPAPFLEQVLEIEADRMFHLQLDSLTFEKERQVVRNERIRKVENSPRALIEEDFQNLFYRTHPYRNPTIGYLPDIEHITLKQVRAYYEAYYRPDNAIMILVGDFQANSAVSLIRRHFDKPVQRPAPSPPPVFELPPAGPRQVIYRSPVFQQPSVRFNFHLPAIHHPDAFALDALMEILGRPSTDFGRLREQLVLKERLAKSASCAGFSFRDGGFLSIRVTTDDSSKIPAIEHSVRKIVNQLKQNLVSEKELHAYKIKTRYLQATQRTSIRSLGEKLLYYCMQGGWRYRLMEEPQLKEQLQPEDIRRVANQYLNFERITKDIRLPEKGVASSLEDETSGKAPDKFYFTPQAEDTLLSESLLNFPLSMDLSRKVKQVTLPNGIQVYLLLEKNVPLFGFQGFWETGDIVENDTFPGIGELLTTLASHRSTIFPEDTFATHLDFYRMRLGFSGGNIDLTCYGEALPEYGDKLLAIFNQWLQAPPFTAEAVARYAEQKEAARNGQQWNPKAEATDTLIQILFKNHPYSRELRTDVAKLKKLTPQKLLKLWNKYVHPERLTLLVYGPLDSSVVVEKLTASLGQWEPARYSRFSPVPIKEPSFPDGQTVHISRPDLKMVEIRVAFPGPALSHPDVIGFEIVSQILARGSVSSYLGKTLRNKLGLTYYIGLASAGGVRPFGGCAIIQSQVTPENLPKFRQTFQKLLQKFPESLSAEQWKQWQARHLLNYLKKFDDLETVLQMIFEHLRNKRPLAEIETYPERIQNLTIEDLRRIARTYFDPSKMIYLEYGPVQ